MGIDVNWDSQGFLHNTHVNRFSVCKGSLWAILNATLVFDLGHGMSCDFVLPILIKVTVLKPKAFFEGYA